MRTSPPTTRSPPAPAAGIHTRAQLNPRADPTEFNRSSIRDAANISTGVAAGGCTDPLLGHQELPTWRPDRGILDRLTIYSWSGLVGVMHGDRDLHPVGDVQLGEQSRHMCFHRPPHSGTVRPPPPRWRHRTRSRPRPDVPAR